MQYSAPGRQWVSFDAGMGCICSADYLGLVMIWRLSLLSPQSKFMELTCRKIILALYNFVCVFEKSLRSKCTTSLRKQRYYTAFTEACGKPIKRKPPLTLRLKLAAELLHEQENRG